MSFIIGANSAVGGGYDVDNSCNFELGSLHKSVSTPSTTFTISVWVKLSNQYVNSSSIGQRYFWTGGGAGGASGAKWNSGNTGLLDFYNEGTGHVDDGTDRQYSDPSAWYHWVWKNSGGTGTLYVNGVQQGSTFSMGPLIGSGGPAVINIGRYGADTVYAPMTLAEFVYLDGTAATPTSFGEFDEDSGIWKPIDVSGLTFGTNGFHLDFSNASALGTDANGGTTLTTTATLSQLTDSPTNNFATLNPLNYTSTAIPYSEGNTYGTFPGAWMASLPTIGLTNGKWFWEAKLNSGNDANMFYGVAREGIDLDTSPQNQTGVIVQKNDGDRYVDGSYSAGAAESIASGNTLGVALDLDSGTKTIKFYKNGTLLSSGSSINLTSNFDGYTLFPIFIGNSSSATAEWQTNFGNPAYAISSGNADGNGYGNFEYAVPSGYFALCTKNLAEHG